MTKYNEVPPTFGRYFLKIILDILYEVCYNKVVRKFFLDLKQYSKYIFDVANFLRRMIRR